jgi:sugar O-acyltransferase (sialic acid O-acetyltransferase NeuD family)
MQRKLDCRQVIIIGAGRHGREIHSYICDLAACGEKISLIGFVDEKKAVGPWEGSRVLGDFDSLRHFLRKQPRSKFYYITATGDNRARKRFVQKINTLSAPNLLPLTLSHPTASIGSKAEIGEGSCFAPGSIITTGVKIGRHCIVNVNTSVSHDCLIGDYTNINPGAVVCGDVKIGQGCYIGAGATIIDKVIIGEWAIIGAGAVVIDNTPANVTVAGVPARIIKPSSRLAV